MALSVWEAAEYFADRRARRSRSGSAHRLLAPYQAIRCADGYITIGAGNDRLFSRLCELLGHPEWATRAGLRRRDARASATAPRSSTRIEAITVDAAAAHWLDRFERTAFRAARSTHYAEVFADPQVQRARNGRRDRSPRARPDPDARIADQDVRDAPEPSAVARRCSASTRARCCARPG